MHELYLSAFVAFEDHTTALRVLQGFCGANPERILRRRLIWEGPRSRVLKGIDPALIARQPQPKIPVWKFLHEQLIRQSYRITLIYEVKEDDFSAQTPGTSFNCDEARGTLSWRDIPDPATNRPVNSRLGLDLPDEKSLCSTLQAIEYRFVREFLQECYRFVYGDVVFYMSRYLEFPQEPQEAQDGQDSSAASPLSTLPSLNSLEPYDAEDKWILTASVKIQNGNDQAQIKDAIEQLMHVKGEFEGCFDFKVIDRIRFDTRVRV